MRILLTGGGTGGHIYPALALYRHLIDNYEQKFDFLYVGTSQGLEKELVSREKIPFQTVASGGITRNISVKNLIVLGKVFTGLAQSAKIIKRFRPQVVVGTGGYVCGPVVLMASLLGIPTIIHEQNAYPGITNKILAPFAEEICLTFPEADKYFAKYQKKIKVTGLPIRPQILQVNKAEALKKLGLDEKKLTILVVGGSRGARRINEAMYDVIKDFSSNNQVQMIIITGRAGYEEFCAGLNKNGLKLAEQGNLFVKPYLDEMEYGLGAADLVIARAGATFLAEITALGIPAILIPYPYAAENHQEYNAQTLVNAGGAIMIKDPDLTGQYLSTQLKELIYKKYILKDMGAKAKTLGQPTASEKLAQVVMAAAKQ